MVGHRWFEDRALTGPVVGLCGAGPALLRWFEDMALTGPVVGLCGAAPLIVTVVRVSLALARLSYAV